METKKERKDVHNIINERILEQLEKGIIPWQKKIAELPKNFISLKSYRGVNVLLLSAIEYPLSYFLSFKQLKEFGGTVRDGEKPTPVVYWKKFDKEKNAGVLRKPVLRYLNLYNISQVEGMPEEKFPSIPQQQNRIEFCKEIVRNMPNKPDIVQDSETTFYSAKSDYIAIQPTHFFENAEEYYSALFHELVQCTGCEKRLARKEYREYYRLPDNEHFTENLIVEIGTFILNAHCGIGAKSADNTVHSVLTYLDKFRYEKKLIVYAASRAQQAVDYILNVKPDTVKKEGGL